MEDFETGAYVGRRRTCSAGEGDVVQAVHKATGATFAMKRVEVTPPSAANAVLHGLTRSATLEPHPVWLAQRPDLSFVQEQTDNMNRKSARCYIIEELGEQNLEREIVDRAVERRPFENIFCILAALLHGLQAFHTQGCLHRDICPRNVFFTSGRARLGRPGMETSPANGGWYPGGMCVAYSADIFALGLVLLEMALLHPIADFGTSPESVAEELQQVGNGGIGALRAWLDDHAASLLSAVPLADEVLEMVAAMLAWPPSARPTTDDLLDWSAVAPFVDPLQVLPPAARPCVVSAHRPGLAMSDVPRRTLLALPGMHVLFSEEGSEQARQDGRYSWCGEKHDLMWFQAMETAVADATDVQALSMEADTAASMPLHPKAASAIATREGPQAAATLLEASREHCAASRFISAEILCRAALLAGANPGSAGAEEVWISLSSTLLQRGFLEAARRASEHAQRIYAQGACDGSGAGARERLFGLGELFPAMASLRPAGSPSCGEGAEAAFRAAHGRLYFRSTLAAETGDWEVLAALGEFYRLLACPEASPGGPAPYMATALSYLEQARALAPGAPFVQDRLQRLEALREV